MSLSLIRWHSNLLVSFLLILASVSVPPIKASQLSTATRVFLSNRPKGININISMASLVSKQTTRGATTRFVGTESAYPSQDKQLRQSAAPRDSVYLWSSLIAGIGSGAISSVLCAPLDLVRTRLQVWSDLKNTPSATLRQTLIDIGKNEGFTGYFRGLGAALLTVPTFWGVYFPLYDEMKRRWGAAYPETQPSLVHCGSAVLAGAVSDLICNPMFVVRTRLQ
jgi:Mitochondrial carrier protein